MLKPKTANFGYTGFEPGCAIAPNYPAMILKLSLKNTDKGTIQNLGEISEGSTREEIQFSTKITSCNTDCGRNFIACLLFNHALLNM